MSKRRRDKRQVRVRDQRAAKRAAERLESYSSCDRCFRSSVPRFVVDGRNVLCSDCLAEVAEKRRRRAARSSEALSGAEAAGQGKRRVASSGA